MASSYCGARMIKIERSDYCCLDDQMIFIAIISKLIFTFDLPFD